MSSVSNYFFDGGNVTNAAVTQGTPTPDGKKRRVTSAIVCNPTGGVLSFTAYVIPSGGTAGTTNTYISARALAAGESYSCPELVGRGMNAGGFIQALGSAGGLTFKYECFEYVGT